MRSVLTLRDSSVRYGLGGLRIESRWDEIFRTPPDRLWNPHGLLYNGYRDSFPGVKRSGLGFDHPLLSNAEVKRVELYLYSSPGLHGLFYGELYFYMYVTDRHTLSHLQVAHFQVYGISK
jgi:hypothetical protein